MDKKDYSKLVKEVNHHNKLYYQDNNPKISDQEYDSLFSQLKEIEKKHPEWISKKSPTQTPGNDSAKGFKKHKHLTPMLSIANTYNFGELKEFCDRVENKLKTFPMFSVEAKMDGAAVNLLYENDQLVVAATRGNGIEGDDITENAKMIKGVKLNPKFSTYNIKKIEIRGEVIMKYDTLEKINKEREELGKPIYANTRNLASGSLKLKDPQEVKNRELLFVLHSFGEIECKGKLNHHLVLFDICKNLGFQPVGAHHAESFEEITDLIETTDKQRHNFDFATDGAVVKVDAFDLRNELGSTGHSPRWVIAYKFPAEAKETLLQDIVYEVGRTGVITPKALFEPVQLAGTTVKQATLHNEDFIVEKDLRIGDIVIVEKGGEIIPKVVKVAKRGKDSKKFKFTERCPQCASTLVREADESAWRCLNNSCPAKLVRRLQHFVSRQCMDIDGLGNEKIEQFVELGLIESFQDIYKLNREKLQGVERLGDRSIEKLLNSIEQSKQRDPSRLLHGLGIPLIGKSVSPLLLDQVSKVKDVFSLSQQEVNSLDGVGDAVYQELQNAKREATKILDELESFGVSMSVEKKITGNSLQGIKICVTGSFSSRSRKDWENYIKENGGKLTGSVSKQTHVLLAGDGTAGGSKLTKAAEYGIKVLNEIEFEEEYANVF